MQKLTLELPEPLFQQLTRIAELTAQPLESLALQSITGNLPPSVENLPIEMQAELSRMQLLKTNQLLEIAHSLAIAVMSLKAREFKVLIL